MITADVLEARERLAHVLSADDLRAGVGRALAQSVDTTSLDALLAWLARSAEPAPAA